MCQVTRELLPGEREQRLLDWVAPGCPLPRASPGLAGRAAPPGRPGASLEATVWGHMDTLTRRQLSSEEEVAERSLRVSGIGGGCVEAARGRRLDVPGVTRALNQQKSLEAITGRGPQAIRFDRQAARQRHQDALPHRLLVRNRRSSRSRAPGGSLSEHLSVPSASGPAPGV